MIKSETKDFVTESLEGIEENVSYIDKIVSDLQDFAKPLKLEYTDVCLQEIITSVNKSANISNDIHSVVNVEPLFALSFGCNLFEAHIE